ncbi:hypothetical protein PO124_17630 [Bacillus licheniformis]|nr:hypothetical protein [Bacillus licheniformis]
MYQKGFTGFCSSVYYKLQAGRRPDAISIEIRKRALIYRGNMADSAAGIGRALISETGFSLNKMSWTAISVLESFTFSDFRASCRSALSRSVYIFIRFGVTRECANGCS